MPIPGTALGVPPGKPCLRLRVASWRAPRSTYEATVTWRPVDPGVLPAQRPTYIVEPGPGAGRVFVQRVETPGITAICLAVSSPQTLPAKGGAAAAETAAA